MAQLGQSAGLAAEEVSCGSARPVRRTGCRGGKLWLSSASPQDWLRRR